VRSLVTGFLFGVAVLTLVGCSKRQPIGSSGYAIVHPQSGNPDGHPGIYLYYKDKQIWFNAFTSENNYHDGILVFGGDIPESLFRSDRREVSIDQESADLMRSPQLFAIHGAGPPVIISERLFNRSLETNLPFTVQGIKTSSNGLSIQFSFEPKENQNSISTNLSVSWPQIAAWLDEAGTSTSVKKSRLGSYRFLPMKQP